MAQQQYSTESQERWEKPIQAKGWLGVIGGVILVVLVIEIIRGTKKGNY